MQACACMRMCVCTHTRHVYIYCRSSRYSMHYLSGAMLTCLDWLLPFALYHLSVLQPPPTLSTADNGVSVCFAAASRPRSIYWLCQSGWCSNCYKRRMQSENVSTWKIKTMFCSFLPLLLFCLIDLCVYTAESTLLKLISSFYIINCDS